MEGEGLERDRSAKEVLPPALLGKLCSTPSLESLPALLLNFADQLLELLLVSRLRLILMNNPLQLVDDQCSLILHVRGERIPPWMAGGRNGGGGGGGKRDWNGRGLRWKKEGGERERERWGSRSFIQGRGAFAFELNETEMILLG